MADSMESIVNFCLDLHHLVRNCELSPSVMSCHELYL
jgi:hypothetical protein